MRACVCVCACVLCVVLCVLACVCVCACVSDCPYVTLKTSVCLTSLCNRQVSDHIGVNIHLIKPLPEMYVTSSIDPQLPITPPAPA